MLSYKKTLPLSFTLLALLIGTALRFYALGDLPAGIYRDEAYYGLDAVSVIEGARPIFFPANNGREPVYIYLLSLSLAAFGRTPFGLRFTAAMIGTLTIAVCYLLGRALFNRRLGVLTMWIGAITFWPVALSRVSFRAGTLPLFLGLAVALGWLAWKRKNVWLAIGGGVAYGLAFNTYAAARITPLALLVFVGYSFFVYRRERKGHGENQPPNAALKTISAFVIATLLVVTPLTLYALANPSQVFAREGQVSIFETESGNPILVLIRHTGLALAMFNLQGDSIARHNLPGRPVFDGVMSIFFVIGLGLIIVRAIRAWTAPQVRADTQVKADTQVRADTQVGPYRVVLTWLAVTLLPTILAADTPHFLRGVGMLPVLWLVPAVGLESVLNLTRLNRPIRLVSVGITISLSTIFTSYDYFSRYVSSPTTHYYFESAATELAAEINSRPGFSNRIDDRLWDNFASLRFLIANRPGFGGAAKVQLAVWPYETEAVRAAVAALPANSQLSVRSGALARGDLESTPYSLYTLYLAEPATPESVTARFGEAVELRRTEVDKQTDQIFIRLGWSISQAVNVDYHVYVHILTNSAVTAQWDGEPLQNQFHFTWLRPGDILNDEYLLSNGEQVAVGVYAPDGAPLGEPVYLK